MRNIEIGLAATNFKESDPRYGIALIKYGIQNIEEYRIVLSPPAALQHALSGSLHADLGGGSVAEAMGAHLGQAGPGGGGPDNPRYTRVG